MIEIKLIKLINENKIIVLLLIFLVSIIFMPERISNEQYQLSMNGDSDTVFELIIFLIISFVLIIIIGYLYLKKVEDW